MESPPIIKLVETYAQRPKVTIEAMKQYDSSQHKVHDYAIRKKKAIEKPIGKDEDGEDIIGTVYEEVNRLSFPFQKLIVKRRVAFMNVRNMEIYSQPETDKGIQLVDMINKIRKDNKYQFKVKELATRQMSELECAELWYSEKDTEYWGDLSKGTARMRMMVLSPKKGDELFPVFSATGDLIYFGRKYKTNKDISLTDFNPDETDQVEYFDIYSKERLERYERTGDGWQLKKTINYSYGKIPIIYYCQDKPEWIDVQPAIERLEELLSNFADSNDYNGSPILKATGEIKGFSAKGERGKVIELEEGADISYVSWDQAPESIKLEIETLNEFIYAHTQTADFSMEKMQGLGGTSGVAFDRVFVDPQLAAQDKLDGGFGEGLQRSVNFLKAACISIDNSLRPAKGLDIEPDIPVFKVNDTKEQIENMLLAAGKPVLSQETASNMVANTLGVNTEEEWLRIEEEKNNLDSILNE